MSTTGISNLSLGAPAAASAHTPLAGAEPALGPASGGPSAGAFAAVLAAVESLTDSLFAAAPATSSSPLGVAAEPAEGDTDASAEDSDASAIGIDAAAAAASLWVAAAPRPNPVTPPAMPALAGGARPAAGADEIEGLRAPIGPDGAGQTASIATAGTPVATTATRATSAAPATAGAAAPSLDAATTIEHSDAPASLAEPAARLAVADGTGRRPASRPNYLDMVGVAVVPPSRVTSAPEPERVAEPSALDAPSPPAPVTSEESSPVTVASTAPVAAAPPAGDAGAATERGERRESRTERVGTAEPSAYTAPIGPRADAIAPTAEAPVAPSAREFTARIVAAAQHSAREGQPTRLVVRLDPPELGQVAIEVVSRGTSVSVDIRPASSDAVAPLRNQHATVEATLKSAGFELSGFDVSNPHARDDRPRPRHARRAPGAAVEPIAEQAGIRPTTPDNALRL